MNIFRLIADMLHLAAICLLLYRIKVSRNCVGKYHKAIKHCSLPTVKGQLGIPSLYDKAHHKPWPSDIIKEVTRPRPAMLTRMLSSCFNRRL